MTLIYLLYHNKTNAWHNIYKNYIITDKTAGKQDEMSIRIKSLTFQEAFRNFPEGFSIEFTHLHHGAAGRYVAGFSKNLQRGQI